MAVTITDEGATILVDDGGVLCYLDKSSLSIGVEGGVNLVLRSGRKKSIFAFADVTSPSEVDADTLAATIEAMKETAGGALPAGAATEAKQDSILTELQLKADVSETQPVSAASLPLPSGAATEAKQDTGNTSVGNIDTSVGEVSATPTANTVQDRLKNIKADLATIAGDTTSLDSKDFATETTLSSINTALDTVETKLQSIIDNTDTLEVNTDGLEAQIGEVSATPTVNTMQDRLKNIKADLATIAGDTTSLDGKDFATETTLASIKTAVELIDNAISGTEMQVDVVTSALPTGAATETTLSSINTALDTVETKLQSIIDNTDTLEVNTDGLEAQIGEVSATPTANTMQDRLKNIKADLATIAGDTTSLDGKDFATETTLSAIKTAVELIDNAIAGTEMQVDVVTSALPTGAATEAKQDSLLTELQLKADVSETQPVNTTPDSGIGHGIKNVAVAGTDEALAASTACRSVVISARLANTGLISVGTSGVDATADTGTGVPLEAGDVVSITIDNLSKIFIDATVNGEGVQYTYTT